LHKITLKYINVTLSLRGRHDKPTLNRFYYVLHGASLKAHL